MKLKRIISAIITASMLIGSVPVLAELDVTGPNMEDHEDWLDRMQAEHLVRKILNGNVAFVAGISNAWVNDKIVDMGKATKYDDVKAEMKISTEAVQKAFGISLTGDSDGYVTSAKIKNETKLNMFVDPRGFVLYSKTESPVVTSIPSGVYSYQDSNTVSDAMSYIAWGEDRVFTEEERKAYLDRWREALVIPKDVNDEKFVSASISTGEATAKKVKINADGTYDFDGIKLEGFDMSGSGLATFKKNYKAAVKLVRDMSIAYYLYSDEQKQTQSGQELKQKIFDSLEILLKLYSQKWNYSTDSKQSWVTTQFEIPIILGNVLCILYDIMDEEDAKNHNTKYQDMRKAFTDQLFDKSPIPDVRTGNSYSGQETYTNRLWRCLSYFNVAVLANDSYRMNYAMKFTSQAYTYTPRNSGYSGNLAFTKDGFYKDGSFVFHNKSPYAMGYGLSYSVLIFEFMQLTKGTKFDITDVYGFDNVYTFCTENLMQFCVNGLAMKMVFGRSDVHPDTQMIRNCCYIAYNAPEEQKQKIYTMAKQILGTRTIPSASMNYEINTPMLQQMLNQVSSDLAQINVSDTNPNASKVFYNQDQVVHRRKDFTAAISMSSSRIAKYEAILPTNGKGWYLGDGMLYIYTDDKQYTNNYFNMINPYFMPGTTVDSTVRTEVTTDTAPNWGMPDNEWAGGVTDGVNTVAGYQLGNKYVSGLKGNKSYFMLGDKVICMGSGITGGEGNVYTVVDNRIIDGNREGKNTKNTDVSYEVKKITCSNPEKSEAVYDTIDSNLNTSLTMASIGDNVTYDFGEKVDIGLVGMSFFYGDTRNELAQLQVSDDGVNFVDALDFASGGDTKEIELVEINKPARYFRVVSKGNSKNAWFNLAEIAFYTKNASADEIEKAKNIVTEGYNDVVINGKTEQPVFNTARSTENAEWAWVEGTNKGEGEEGFVFLNNTNLTECREKQPSASVYLRLVIEHGEGPKGAQYAYVILPKASLDETKAYAENPDIEIIEQSEAMHAVYDKKNNIIAANIFRKGTELAGITFNSTCCVMINKNTNKIYITDPTWKLDKLAFTLPENAASPTGANLTVSGTDVILDTSSYRGQTNVISCNLDKTQASNSQIKVMDYYLRTSEQYISTDLYAESKNGEVTFKIIEPPTSGRAVIENGILYYYSGQSNDKLVIEAMDEEGNKASFSVNITD